MPGVMRTLGARFKLEGEDEFKNVVSQLNAGARTLRSEMNLLQAQYQGNTDSVEFLTEKSELLGRMLDQQKEKTAATQKMLESASKAYAKAQEEAAQAAGKSKEEQDKANAALRDADQVMQKYAAALNNAQAEEYKLQHQIDETTAAMNGQGEEMVGLGDTVSDLAEKFGIQLPQGISDALNSMSSFSAGTVAAMGVAVAAIAGVIEAVKALHENAVEYAAQADEIMSQSLVTNLSTTLLQELEYAAPLIDVDVNTITGSMSKLTKEMADAAGGNEGLQESFAALGVSITEADGQLRSAEDVFFEVVDALGEMGNDTERDAMAMSLLGKSAQELNPLIKQGTSTLREYMDAADENYVLTEDQIQALGDLDDAVQTNELRWEALKKQLAAQFAPIATKVLTTFGELIENVGKILVDSGIIEGIGTLLDLFIALIEPINEIFRQADDSPNHLNILHEAIKGVAMAIAALADALNWTIGLLETLTIVGAKAGLERMGNAMGYGAKNGNYSFSQRVNGTASVMEAERNGYVGNGGEDLSRYPVDPNTGLHYDPVTGNYIFPGQNATGNDSWRGGLTWVGETGPELVDLPAGSRVYNAQDSRNMTGGDTFYITIDAKSVKEFNDIVEIAQSARVRSRMR